MIYVIPIALKKQLGSSRTFSELIFLKLDLITFESLLSFALPRLRAALPFHIRQPRLSPSILSSSGFSGTE